MKLGFAVVAASTLLVQVVSACGDGGGGASGSQTSQTSQAAVAGSSSPVSAVPATAIPDGTAVASTSVDATVANSIGDTKGVDLLTAWPSPPTGPPDLADVPMLLPMSAMTGTPSRVEYADDRATYVDYNQYWLDGSDGTLLSLQTDLLQGPSSGGEPVNVDPWDRAFYPLMSTATPR